MIKTFHEKLNDAIHDVNHMGKLVQSSVEDAIKALLESDMDLAKKVIKNDNAIDDLNMQIEEKCLIIQAEYQPFAKDLRLITSIYIIIVYLERIGDLAVNLAKVAKRLKKHKAKFFDTDTLDLLKEMGELAKSVLNKALKAFKNKDAKLAAKLELLDNEIDHIQKTLFKKLFSSVIEGEASLKEELALYISNVSLAGRYLERIGDQAVNVGERVMYVLTGEFKNIHDDL
jgi:phosphate transport system protein